MVTHRDPGNGPEDRIPPTGRLTVTTPLTRGSLACHSGPMSDGLATLRILYLGVLNSTVIIGVVMGIMVATDAFPPGSGGAWIGLVVVAAAGLVTLTAKGLAPRLDCSTPGKLAGTYRVRFIVRLTLAEAPVLAGFVGALVTGEPLLFLVGLPFAVVGYTRAAPTRRNIDRDQDELLAFGCGTSLLDALGATSR
jgi:hypothetical protein